jgi:hypothetical protein
VGGEFFGVRNASVFTVIMARKKNSIFFHFFIAREWGEIVTYITNDRGGVNPFAVAKPLRPQLTPPPILHLSTTKHLRVYAMLKG